MTAVAEVGAPPPGPPPATSEQSGRDKRASPVPTAAMISSLNMGLRKRHGLVIVLGVLTIGIPAIFLVIRLLLHAFSSKSYGPAGGFPIFQGLVGGSLYLFGFIAAVTLGCTAGAADLGEGVFRHLVVTGRSRIALYLARIPAGLAIIVPLVAVGFALVCFVSVYAAPTTLNYNGVNIPAGMSLQGLENFAANHADEVVCDFGFNGPLPANLPCGNGPGGGGVVTIGPGGPGPSGSGPVTKAEIRSYAIQIARQNYASYSGDYLSPPIGLMVKSGLWIELWAIIGFVVALGLSSLIGQRTISLVILIIVELVLTPIAVNARIPHMWNVQRGIIGLAVDHLEPNALGFVFGGGNHGNNGPNLAKATLLPETTKEAVFVVVAWLVVWTVLGAWRMARRDA